MAKVRSVPLWQRAVIVLSGTVVGLVVVLGLQGGRPVLIPIALALLLTFLLNPLVRALEHRGLGRVSAVLVAVSTTGIILMCLGWMVTRQVAGMLVELPQNTANIKVKLKTLRGLGSGPIADQFNRMIEELSQDIPAPPPASISIEKGLPQTANEPLNSSPGTKVIVQPEGVPWLSMTGYLSSAFEVLVTLGFALVLLIFFLLGREDLRDRAIMLAGKARLTVTSKAMEEVTTRISRYVQMVGLVNGGFGLLLTAGLYLFGVPYSLLWGSLAAGLRFVPYIGPWIGAFFPIVISLATFEGWWQPLAVFAFVTVLELTFNNVVEPLAFGHTTGVSPTALIVSAAFWFYLWGPIGLVLSAPIAICLLVLGKHIPQLGFLSLLLGDAPALKANLGIYQRLILGDELEAVRLLRERLKEIPAEQVYDDMLVPALNYANRDSQQEFLSEEDQHIVLRGIRECLRQLEPPGSRSKDKREGKSDPEVAFIAPSLNVQVLQPLAILGCPATDDKDGVGLELLRHLLDPQKWQVEIASLETLTATLVARVIKCPPDVICIAALPTNRIAHARYLCKRLRQAAPNIPIIVGRWGQNRQNKLDRERLELAGATCVTKSLVETAQWLESQFPSFPREALSVSLSDIPQPITQAGSAAKV